MNALCICIPAESFELGLACGALFASLLMMVVVTIIKALTDGK